MSLYLRYLVFGVYIAIKSRYPGRINFIKEQTIELFDEIVKNLDEVSILYKGNQIGHNLVLIKGAIVNMGKIDISEPMVNKPISVSLPNDYKWLTAKIISTSDDVRSSIYIKESNSIEIDPGFFRCGEFIRFQALAEVPDDEDNKTLSEKLESNINFTHRIQNTRKIDVKTIENTERLRKRKNRVLLIMTMPIIAIIFLSTIFITGFPKQMAYNYKEKNGKVILVTAHLKHHDEVKIEGVNEDYKKIISFNDFVNKTTGNLLRQKRKI